MAELNLALNPGLLPNLLTEGGDGLKKLVESVLNQVLEALMTEHLEADRHERSEERAGYRNGVRERALTTRVDTLILRFSQTRDGSFSTGLFRRYQRSEQALVLSMHGEGGAERLDPESRQHHRGAVRDPFLEVHGEPVVDRTFPQGPGLAEPEAFQSLSLRADQGVKRREWVSHWNAMLEDLKRRGLSGADLIVSDQPQGPQESRPEAFSGSPVATLPGPLSPEHSGSCAGLPERASGPGPVPTVSLGDDGGSPDGPERNPPDL